MTAQPVLSGRAVERQRQLTVVAARLFQARGFHNVTLDEIAAELGITGPALYRYFRGKQGLLARTLMDQIAAVAEVCEAVPVDDGEPVANFSDHVFALTRLVLEREDAMLWKQERRHLTGAVQYEFRNRVVALGERTARLIARVLPQREEWEHELLAWSLLSVFSYARSYRTSLSRSEIEVLLASIGDALLQVRLLDSGRIVSLRVREPAWVPHSRRERILDATATLFERRGYHGVSIDDIATASETAIATVYQHFPTKAQVLYGLLSRGVEGTHYAMAHRLAAVHDPSERLQQIVRTYTELAFGPHGRLLAIFVADLFYLPAAEQESLVRMEREHLQEWIDGLRAVRPTLSGAAARARARTAMGLIVDLCGTARLRSRPGVSANAAELALAVLMS